MLKPVDLTYGTFFIVQVTALAGASLLSTPKRLCSCIGKSAREEQCSMVSKIHYSLVPIYFQHAYRMSYELFLNLDEKLKDGLEIAVKETAARRTARNGSKKRDKV